MIRQMGRLEKVLSRTHRVFTRLSVIIGLLTVMGCGPAPDSTSVSLNLEADWQFRRVGEDRWCPASVPGCVHTDLLANNLIPDPFFRDNENRLQWISQNKTPEDRSADWEYHGTFTLPDKLANHDRVELVFQGLDVAATVYLNERKILVADNMFRTWNVEVKPLLKPGRNVLRIYFRSALAVAGEFWRRLGYELPGGPQVMIRKAPYQFGWDWGPRFITAGIWRPVQWRAWSQIRLSDAYFRTLRLSPERADMEAMLSIQSDQPENVDVWVESPGTGASGEKIRELTHLKKRVEKGETQIVLPFVIANPKPWNPNGRGTPHLTRLQIRISSERGAYDRLEQQVGIRTIELVTTPDQYGSAFYFKINGDPVYIKGANYIPQDSFPSRVSQERSKKLIREARDAGMNMLRVWGGGVYEDEHFYNLCDENGLLVWQDFMFACAMYPGGEAFRETVKQEGLDNIRRLRKHACLALWCGNNEISEGWARWGWQTPFTPEQRERIAGDYQFLFHELLPGMVKEHAPGQAYWPSSPLFGRGDPRSLGEGDLHYWGVWHDAEPYEVLQEKTGRFMSEFGVQSFPSLESIEQFTIPEDRRLNSPVLNVHQKHPRGQALIEMYMKQNYPPPKDFVGFVYLSQISQAEGMRVGLEAQRRAMPFCMGSLFWQLNDCWPAVSWSAIDYYGRPKALYYHAKNVFKPLLLSAVREKNETRIFLVSDEPERIPGTLKVKLMDFDGKSYWQEGLMTAAEPGQSLMCWSRNLDNARFALDPTRSFLWAGFYRGDRLLADCRLYFAKTAQLKLVPPDIRFTVQNGSKPGEVSVSLTCSHLAKSVELHLPGMPRWSDNFFDLIPGMPVSVSLYTDLTVSEVRERLRIASLTDYSR